MAEWHIVAVGLVRVNAVDVDRQSRTMVDASTTAVATKDCSQQRTPLQQKD